MGINELCNEMMHLDSNGFWYEIPNQIDNEELEELDALIEIENTLHAWLEDAPGDKHLERLLKEVKKEWNELTKW